jgi:hypothetical protein
MWACFPAGPLERQFEEGIQGGNCEKRSIQDLQEGVTLLGRDIFGEASANYLVGCPICEKVASEFGLPRRILRRNPAAEDSPFYPAGTCGK